MFTKTVILAALATLAIAAPTARQTDEIFRFEAIAAHSTSAIHLEGIQAAGLKFYVGGQSNAYCPSGVVNLNCSDFSNATIFAKDLVAGNDYLGLDTTVPGGQNIYLATDGSLSFTEAHSGYIPPGSAVEGFTYIAPIAPNDIGQLQFNGSDWAACIADNGRYQVFAAGASGFVEQSSCIGFDFLTHVWTGMNAWQYD